MSVEVVARGVGRWSLEQGRDPLDLLAAHGWTGEPVRAVRGRGGQVEVHYAVVRLDRSGASSPLERSRPGARVLQRVAAYALVTDADRLLMSRLSHRVPGAAGLWTLPGGGVDPGEEPLATVVREVHEETGQHVVVDGLVQVQSQRSLEPGNPHPDQHEDMHAVRLVHRAHCPRPTEARVLEIEGSTGESAWVPLDQLPELPLASMVEAALPYLR